MPFNKKTHHELRRRFKPGTLCWLDHKLFSSSSLSRDGILAAVTKSPYTNEHGETWIHIVIESEEIKDRKEDERIMHLRHDEEWPEDIWRRKLFEIRAPIERVTVA